MNEDKDWSTPNAEETRMVIRNSIDIILSQPPILNRSSVDKVFKEILGDYFPTDYDKFVDIFVEDYLKKGGKYFLKNLIFKAVDRFLNDEEYNKNLENLFILLLREKALFFQNEKVKESLNNLNEDNQIERLISILVYEPKILDFLTKGKEVIKEFLKTKIDQLDYNDNRKIVFSFVYIILLYEDNNIDEVKNSLDNYIYYIDLGFMSFYEIYKTKFNNELRKIFLDISINKLKNLGSFDYAYRFISSNLSFLLDLVDSKNQLLNIFNAIRENKGLGKINQILFSNQSFDNINIIIEKIPNKILLENEQETREFIKYVCEYIFRANFENEDDCKEYFYEKIGFSS